MLELLIILSAAYAVASGKVKDINSAARMVGQIVGRASGSIRRLRAQAAEFAAAAASRPGVAESSAQLQNTMSRFREIRAETASVASLSGNRAFVQNHFRERWAGNASSASAADAVFSEAEIHEALGRTPQPAHPKNASAGESLKVANDHSPSLQTVQPPFSDGGHTETSISSSVPGQHSNAVSALCAALDAERSATEVYPPVGEAAPTPVRMK